MGACKVIGLAVMAAALGSCGGDGGQKLHKDLVPLTAPAGGLELYTPILRVPKGKDVTYCTFTDVVTTERMLVKDSEGVQTPYGHHAILFYTLAPIAPQTIECEAADMDNFRQVLGGSGGEGASFWTPPDNVATEIPAGVQLIVQSHWTNYGEGDVDVQAMMVTIPTEMRADTVLAGPTVVTSTRLRVPPNAAHTESTECTFTKQKKLMMFLGHEHERGKHVKIELLRGGTTSEMLLDRDFQPPNDVFDPPVTTFDLAAPLVIDAGDKIRVTCDWQNNTPDQLEFPLEMCVFFGYSMDGQTEYCVNGEWNRQ